MKKRTRKGEESCETDHAREPLVGLEPNFPPRKNVPLLVVAIAAFGTWLGFLVWMASQSL